MVHLGTAQFACLQIKGFPLRWREIIPSPLSPGRGLSITAQSFQKMRKATDWVFWVTQGSCPHPLTPGGCSSPSSRPCTSPSAQIPGAATLPRLSQRPHPPVSAIPVITVLLIWVFIYWKGRYKIIENIYIGLCPWYLIQGSWNPYHVSSYVIRTTWVSLF